MASSSDDANGVELVFSRTQRRMGDADAAESWANRLATRAAGPIGAVFVNVTGNRLSSLNWLRLDVPHGPVVLRVGENRLASLSSLAVDGLVVLEAGSRWPRGGNSLRVFDAPEPAVAALAILNLDCVGLEVIPPRALALTLESLSLHNNALRALPETLADLNALRTLVLSSNPFEASALGALPQGLTRVDLCDCPLGTLPLGLRGLSALRQLALANCLLRDLEPSIVSTWRALETLDVAANELGDVDAAVFALPELRLLDLSDNPAVESEPVRVRMAAFAVPELRVLTGCEADDGGEGSVGESDMGESECAGSSSGGRSELFLDQDLCGACRLAVPGATVLLCDGCDTGWHLDCVGVPSDAVPNGDWFCPPCSGADVPRL